MEEEAKQKLAWTFSWISLGLFLSSKESLRYTALWRFDEKPIALVIVIGILFAATFLSIMYMAKKQRVRPHNAKPLIIAIIVLGLMQTAGMVVHFLSAAGFTFIRPVVDLSTLAHEISILLLFISSGHLLSMKSENPMKGFAYGVALSGGLQVFLVFLDVAVARCVAVSLCLVAAALLCSSIVLNNNSTSHAHYSSDNTVRTRPALSLPNLKTSMSMIFLASLMLMGAYAQWQGQQDGEMASTLIQICSGLGLIVASALFTAIQKRLDNNSLFLLCQTIILPIVIGSLYLSAIFEGPVISISLVLFDLAYGMILFTIWLSPIVYTRYGVVYTVAAGFFAHKMGWTVGIAITKSFPWHDYAWISTIVMVVAFLLLFALSITSLIKCYRSTNIVSPDPPTQSLEKSCALVADRYGLTKREGEVLILLAKGRTAAYLARDLYLSESTVRTHTAHIYHKLNINSQQMLIDIVEKAEPEKEEDTSERA